MSGEGGKRAYQSHTPASGFTSTNRKKLRFSDVEIPRPTHFIQPSSPHTPDNHLLEVEDLLREPSSPNRRSSAAATNARRSSVASTSMTFGTAHASAALHRALHPGQGGFLRDSCLLQAPISKFAHFAGELYRSSRSGRTVPDFSLLLDTEKQQSDDNEGGNQREDDEDKQAEAVVWDLLSGWAQSELEGGLEDGEVEKDENPWNEAIMESLQFIATGAPLALLRAADAEQNVQKVLQEIVTTARPKSAERVQVVADGNGFAVWDERVNGKKVDAALWDEGKSRYRVGNALCTFRELTKTGNTYARKRPALTPRKLGVLRDLSFFRFIRGLKCAL
jgi:hypothetical protein